MYKILMAFSFRTCRLGYIMYKQHKQLQVQDSHMAKN